MTEEAPAPQPATEDPTAAATERPLAVRLERVARRFGREQVLRGLSLRLPAGRIVALRGSNGSGKTTLLRLLATRLRPSSGRASVFGRDLVREAAAVRREVAYLAVHGGSYGTLTARENLRLACVLTGAPQDGVDAELARVGLSEHADRPVRVFSSGMKRRLGLARLALRDAALWLLDEPYASLDEEGRELVDDLLSRARARGRTVLIASHEPERLAGRIDASITIDRGVLLHGATE